MRIVYFLIGVLIIASFSGCIQASESESEYSSLEFRLGLRQGMDYAPSYTGPGLAEGLDLDTFEFIYVPRDDTNGIWFQWLIKYEGHRIWWYGTTSPAYDCMALTSSSTVLLFGSFDRIQVWDNYTERNYSLGDNSHGAFELNLSTLDFQQVAHVDNPAEVSCLRTKSDRGAAFRTYTNLTVISWSPEHNSIARMTTNHSGENSLMLSHKSEVLLFDLNSTECSWQTFNTSQNQTDASWVSNSLNHGCEVAELVNGEFYTYGRDTDERWAQWKNDEIEPILFEENRDWKIVDVVGMFQLKDSDWAMVNVESDEIEKECAFFELKDGEFRPHVLFKPRQSCTGIVQKPNGVYMLYSMFHGDETQSRWFEPRGFGIYPGDV